MNENGLENLEQDQCPLCHAPVSLDWEKCKLCGTSLEDESESRIRLGQIIAGLVLLVNGMIQLFFIFIQKRVEAGPVESPGNSVSSIIIAILLIFGHRKGILWGRAGVLIGAVVFPVLYISQNDPVTAIFQILFSLSLIGLLFGQPGKIRIGICISMLGLIFLLDSLGLYAELTGRNPIMNAVAEMSFDLEQIENNEVSGRFVNYSLQIPPKSTWKKVSEKQIQSEIIAADLFLVNPDYGAHVVVLAEPAKTDLASYLKFATTTAESSLTNCKIQDRATILTDKGHEGRVFKMTGVEDGYEVVYKYGIFIEQNYAFQIICFSEPEDFEKLNRDFSYIIHSFAFKK